MENALIVTHSEKGAEFFADILGASSVAQIATAKTCAEARRALAEQDFDLVIIDAPLKDENGEDLSRQVAAKGATQVMLVVKNEHLDSVSAVCETDGIFVVAKPMSKTVIAAALKLAKSAQIKLRREQAENARLKQALEDARIVNRAKCILISNIKMSEQEAHRFIEKQAMDMRSTRRAVAEGILRTYEN